MTSQILASTAGLPEILPERVRRSRYLAWVPLLSIVLVGAAARLYRLSFQNLWMDEVASLDNAHAFAVGGLRGLAKADHVAPLHSLILWAITQLGVDDAIALRLPSVIAGILTVPVFYLLALRLFGSRTTALISAALLALSPFAIWYSQEARMYALLLFWSCAYVAVSWPVVERALKPGELVLLAAITTLGLYTHHYMAFLSAAFGIFLLCRGGLVQRRAWLWAGTQLVAVLLFAYWMLLTADKLEAPTGLPKPDILLWTPYTLFSFIYGLSFGPSVRELRIDGASAGLLHHSWSIGAALFAAVVLGTIGLRRAMRPDMRLAGIWLITWLVVPIGLAVTATFLSNITYNVRYVITSFPPILLFLALAIAEPEVASSHEKDAYPRSRPAQLIWGLKAVASALLLACVLMSLRNWYFDSDYAKEDVRSVAGLLRTSNDPDMVLAIDNFRAVPILRYYDAAIPSATFVVDTRRTDRLPDDVVRALAHLPADKPRDIWLIEYRSWESDPTDQLKTYLDATARLVDERRWPGVTVLRYRTRASAPS